MLLTEVVFCMQNRYLYNLPVKELREAAKKNPNVTHGTPLAMLYADIHAKKNTNDEWTGIRTFYTDVNRTDMNRGTGIKINGEYIPIPKGETNNVIQTQLKISPEKIDTSFSQNLMHLAVHPLQTNKEIGMPNNIVCQPNEMEADIYRNNEDVYYKIKVKQYNFAYTDVAVKKNVIVNGPLEILYKLVDSHEGSQFALQQISTNSAFLRAAFLGEKGLEKQLERAGNTQVVLKKIEEMLIVPLEKLNKVSLTQPEVITHKAYYDALTAVGHYQKGTISASQLVNELEKQESIVVKATEKSQPIFRRRSSIVDENSASYALKIAIKTAKALPYSEVKNVKTNINSLQIENKKDANDSKDKATEEQSSVSKMRSSRSNSL